MTGWLGEWDGGGCSRMMGCWDVGLAGRGLDAEFICHDHVGVRSVWMWIFDAAACVMLPDASAAVKVAFLVTMSLPPNALPADPFSLNGKKMGNVRLAEKCK